MLCEYSVSKCGHMMKEKMVMPWEWHYILKVNGRKGARKDMEETGGGREHKG